MTDKALWYVPVISALSIRQGDFEFEASCPLKQTHISKNTKVQGSEAISQ